MPRGKTKSSNAPQGVPSSPLPSSASYNPKVAALVAELGAKAPASCNAEVAALVAEFESKWTDPLEGKTTSRKLTREAALDIVRRLGEGLDIARVLAPWRITRDNLALWEVKADEGREPYATFFHYFARAQNVLRGQLLTSIAMSGDVKAKIELLRATTPEFAPEPSETTFNLRPQFMGAMGPGTKTTVNVLSPLPPYQPPPIAKAITHESDRTDDSGTDQDHSRSVDE